MNKHSQSRPDVKMDYNSIGTGPLTLAGSYTSPLASALSHEIALLVPCSRPGSANQGHLLLGLKYGAQTLDVLEGEKIYLDHSNLQQLKFSSKSTQTWLKLSIVDPSSIMIEAETIEAETIDRSEFVLKAIEKRQEQTSFYSLLKKAKWWGQDVLFQLYGGKEYQPLKDKHKIEQNAVFYVAQGDYLTFEEEHWKVVDLSAASLAAPLAYVKEISASILRLVTWDNEGFALEEIKLHPEARPKPNTQNELFSSIRFRTATQVTCLLGKRRVILKCGDWLLKTAHGWRNLKKLSEIESYLSHQLRGELFIFDAIEKREDKFFVKGHLIDEMRTSAQPISLPVIYEKKIKSTKKKKKL
ncbi:MAG TPA: hypothetical protein VLF61_00890 [Rhabdochlamydiaceae bacterium]|nr:hypothetical protein [Rhabdochlamydiaceae bacterium]